MAVSAGKGRGHRVALMDGARSRPQSHWNGIAHGEEVGPSCTWCPGSANPYSIRKAAIRGTQSSKQRPDESHAIVNVVLKVRPEVSTGHSALLTARSQLPRQTLTFEPSNGPETCTPPTVAPYPKKERSQNFTLFTQTLPLQQQSCCSPTSCATTLLPSLPPAPPRAFHCPIRRSLDPPTSSKPSRFL